MPALGTSMEFRDTRPDAAGRRGGEENYHVHVSMLDLSLALHDTEAMLELAQQAPGLTPGATVLRQIYRP